MKRIGKFRGIPCYKCDYEEFVDNKLFFETENIYIIGEQMVQNNRVIGTYDGYQVYEKDVPYGIYYSISMADIQRQKKQEEKKTQEFRDVESVSVRPAEVETAEVDYKSLMNQVRFEDYTTVVDNFFASL